MIKESEEFNIQYGSLLPVATSLLFSTAIIFDVGYFVGLDINLFTLFSLSEHLVFSLEAIPFSIILFILALLIIGGVKTLDRFSLRSDDHKTASNSTRKHQNRRKYLKFFSKILSYSIIALPAILYYFEHNIIYIYSFMYFVYIQFVFWSIGSSLIKRGLLGNAVLATVIVYPLIYSFGYWISKSYYLGDKETHSLDINNSDPIRGRLIRSGEKGVLFKNQYAKQVTLFKWDEIKRINKLP